ncbi:MAG: DUF1592 domain-containing protein [Gemmataceae bacterium]|nr:DUF1592 domain-containing protein [Gemmataceae bacterium]
MSRWVVCTAFLAVGALETCRGDEDPVAKAVRPFLDQFCVQCHNEKKDSGGLNLQTRLDVETWETIARRVELKEMPPKKHAQPADEQRKAFVASVQSELKKLPVAAGHPGRVTMRRLNRVEYNNTVRDLCGITFTPADDFPSDDVGHGFDNIGDVLSLPPILMEKYLAAAEKVVDLMLNGEPAKPEIRRYEAKDLKPTAQAEVKRRNNRSYRHLDKAGALFVDHEVPWDGEIVIRATAFGAPFPGDRKIEAVKYAFEVDGKRIAEHRLPTNTFTGIEAKAKVSAGTRRIALVLLNPSPDEEKNERRTLGVAAIEIVNPPNPVMRKPDTYFRVMLGDPKDESRERARAILSNFTRRAYRRPPRADEVERLLQIYDSARNDGETFDSSVGLCLQAVLVSPYFLFRVEPDREPDRDDGSYALNSWEIASRLSYFLWSTMPDEELFRLAEQGKLRDPIILEQQTRRMLFDPKAAALVQNFGMQWLNLRNLATVQPSRKDFPVWDEKLREWMRIETEMFLTSIIAENRSILDLLDADYTFVNERLARLYGIPDVKGEEFRRVKLTDRNRGGVLTQASVLTVTSNPTRTSPVKRGKWVLENILGTPPPPPPPDVPELKEDRESAKSASLRERMQQHRADPNCATCHERMDTIGFGFENFDGVGGWRETDGEFKIDASGTLPDGSSFRNPAELKAILKRDVESFRKCLIEKLLTYALGRGVERHDRSEIERISAAVAADGDRFNRIVVEIVKSDAFLRRMGRK